MTRACLKSTKGFAENLTAGINQIWAAHFRMPTKFCDCECTNGLKLFMKSIFFTRYLVLFMIYLYWACTNFAHITETANITASSSNQQHIPQTQHVETNQENRNGKYICIRILKLNWNAVQV